jgi:hypothetical protein
MRKLSSDIFSIFIAVTFSFSLLAQQSNSTFEYQAPLSELNHINTNFHEGVKPYNHSEIELVIDIDSINKKRSHLHSKEKEPKDLSCSILPLINFSSGIEKSASSRIIFESNVGVNFNTKFKDRLHFNTYYHAGLNKYPSYINKYINETSIVPQEGFGRVNAGNVHFRNFGGYLSYSPSEIFNFEIGHGKNHWGNGYRSLLLSDATNNYSYAKITTTIWKFKYVNLYTNFKDIGDDESQSYWKNDNKFGTFHYLSWNLTKRINISFFESVIWQAQDTLVNRGFDVNYLNPVIFYRPVEYSIGSSDNSLMGMNIRYKATNNIQLYGQLILDEFLLNEVRTDFLVKAKRVDSSTPHGWWANKQGYQLGLKWNNIIKNLSTLLEYNTVRPYTYSHISGKSNYGHYNQSLAHPYGANFKEYIWIVNYQKEKLNITFKNIYSLRGLDTETTNYGGDIFKPYTTREGEYFNYTGQGITSKVIFTDLKISYIILPKNMLHAFVGVRNRMESIPTSKDNSTFVYLGIKTSLYNTYHDF